MKRDIQTLKKTESAKMIKRGAQSGFTLIEMSIVMMILGIILVAGLKLYDNYVTHQTTVVTSSNVSLSSRAMSDYRARFGRYPCPASLTAPRGSAEYGREGDCNPNALARDGVTAGDEAPANNTTPGTFANGFYVEQSARMIDIDGDGTDDINPLVVRGAIPFRDLNLPEEFAYDGYGQRLSYAVTARAAVQDTFNPRQGGIAIVDTQSPPQSLIETPDSALFIVMSAGADGDGAFSRDGMLIQACPSSGTDIEEENCNLSSTESKFVHIQRQGEFDSTYFDDNLAYYSGVEDSLWEIAEADPEDIILRQDGRVNVNVKNAASVLPDNSLYVNGVIRAVDNYLAQQICDSMGTSCFTPDLIGGALADGGGMECPPGEYMYGISMGAPLCAPEPAVSELRCPSGQFMVGMDADGTLKCQGAPQMCESENRTICGESKSLPKVLLNTNHTLTGGVSRSELYRCRTVLGVVRWETNPFSVSGVCTCDPTQTLNNVGGCGTGYTGTRPYTQTRQCPSGTWGPVTYTNGFNTDCTCVGYTEYRNLSCGGGFSQGVDRERRDWTCDGSNNLVPSAWYDDPANGNPCACVEQTVSETNLPCQGGLDGTYSRTNHLSCPGATWDAWIYDYSGCTCNSGKTRTRVVSCTAPELGAITEQDTYTCTSATTGYWNNAWTEIDNTCATPPPTICVWKPVGTPVQVTTQPNVPRSGKECTCGSASGGCYEYGDPNYLKYNLCTCE